MQQADNFKHPDLSPLMVSIRCITYNHEPYIRQCLEGFVMQKTNFRFEAIVHDDASTDGTAAIIREYAEKYPDIIKPIYETENQYSKHDGSLRRIMDEACKGKYIAFCEGDDYWTDPLKLQKQVDILEHNPSIILVHTAFQVIDDKNTLLTMEPFISFMNKSKTGDVFKQLIRANYILTLTTCIRYEVLENTLYKRCPFSMDYLVFLTAAAMGDIFYLSEITGCYRRTPTGAMMSNLEKVVTTSMKIREYFHEAILKNEIPKYKFYEYTKLKYITATYAFNRYWYSKDKAPFEKYRKINGLFNLYFTIAFIQKRIGKLFHNQ